MPTEIDTLATTLWDYNLMHQPLKHSDAIIVLGSHDLRVAERGAQLYLEGYAPVIVFSGGLGRLTNKTWNKPEAQMFAEVARRMGVPDDVIFLEDTSRNTGENIQLTKELLQNHRFTITNAIIVTKPYMERRAFATAKKFWPTLDITMASPLVSYEHYPNAVISKDEMLSIMVGDTQRIMEYPEKGFMIEQEMPEVVRNAYDKLVALGYTSQLIKPKDQ